VRELRSGRVRSAIERFAGAIERVAGLFLAAITVLVFVSAILRYLFAAPIPDGFDVSRLLLGVAVFWGLASVGFRDEHIRVDLVWTALGPRARRAMDGLASVVTVAFFVVFVWMLVDKVASTYAANEQTFDLRLPIWPFYAVAVAGTVAAVAMLLARLILNFGGAAPQRPGESPGGEGT